MNLKDIKKYYEVKGVLNKDVKNEYNLHSLESVGFGRTPFPYLCTIIRKGDKFGIKEFNKTDYSYTNNVEELHKWVNIYVQSLPHSSDNYNPNYRTGLFEEYCIYDYLIKLGCESNGINTYSLPTIEDYHKFIKLPTLSIWGLDGDNNNTTLLPTVKDKKITINLLSIGDYIWQSITTSNKIDDIINGINTLIKPYLLTQSAFLFQLANKIPKIENITINMFDGNINSKKEFNEDLIKSLEDLIKELKQNY